MSISSVTSANRSLQNNPYVQAKQAFQSLGNALQSGNLTAAQQAFAQLQQYSPGNGQASNNQNSTSTTTSNVTDPLQALGTALQSGNLSAAQQAFTQLQQQAATKGHGHHHHRQDTGTAQSSSGTQTQGTTYSNQGNVLNTSATTALLNDTSSSTASTGISILS